MGVDKDKETTTGDASTAVVGRLDSVVRCEPEYLITLNFNSVEIKSFDKIEDGRLVHYSYSIERDQNGIEVSRTEPTRTGTSIGWSDGTWDGQRAAIERLAEEQLNEKSPEIPGFDGTTEALNNLGSI